MKVVILTNEQPNQTALCNKIAARAEIAAIVLSDNIPRRKPRFSKNARLRFNALMGRLLASDFRNTWFRLLSEYSAKFPKLPDAKVVRVKNVNDDLTAGVIESTGADLVVVSGTNLVGKRVIKAAGVGRGVVNLHTGISPYVKGGPNCTNWCLATGAFHLIGNTVMWLDLGIDTGNLIATERTPLDGNETLFELHWRVMEHGHSLYVDSIARIGEGVAVKSVPQRDLGDGVTFYSVEWNYLQMRKALRNFEEEYSRFFDHPKSIDELMKNITLVPLNS